MEESSAQIAKSAPRYIVSPHAEPVHLPIADQVYFRLDYLILRNTTNVALWNVLGVSFSERGAFKWYEISYRLLNQETGLPIGKKCTYSVRTEEWPPREAPYFVKALDTWLGANAHNDLVQMIGLVNAKCMDLQKDVTRITEILGRLEQALKDKKADSSD